MSKIYEQNESIIDQEGPLFTSVDEAIIALSEVEICDLKSSKTSKQDAIDFCKQVMKLLSRCRKLNFNEKELEEFSVTLLTLGCTKQADANKKFIDKSDLLTSLEDIINRKDDITFPLYVFDNLIGTKNPEFKFSLLAFFDGGIKTSWAGDWLKAQEKERTITS